MVEKSKEGSGAHHDQVLVDNSRQTARSPFPACTCFDVNPGPQLPYLCCPVQCSLPSHGPPKVEGGGQAPATVVGSGLGPLDGYFRPTLPHQTAAHPGPDRHPACTRTAPNTSAQEGHSTHLAVPVTAESSEPCLCRSPGTQARGWPEPLGGVSAPQSWLAEGGEPPARKNQTKSQIGL